MKKTKAFMLSLMMMLSTAAVAKEPIVGIVDYSKSVGSSFAELLRNTLGDRVYTVDSLVIYNSGYELPLDWTDALRECCENGSLTGINLSQCQLLTEIPAGAFMSSKVNSAPAKSSAEKSDGLFTGLRYITLPQCLEKIGANAFCCTDLRGIEIPYWVSEIGTGAFAGCGNLTDVVLRGDRLYADDMAEFAGLPTGAVLHVAPGRGSSYRGNEAWSAFSEVREDDTAFKAIALTLDGSELLADVLGSDNMFVDSLSISGVLNKKDFEVLRHNSIYGHLYSLDFTGLDVGQSADISLYGSMLHTLTLPQTLTEIPPSLIARAVRVDNLTLPASYDRIRHTAFRLFRGTFPDSTFVVVEGCRRIDTQAFDTSYGIKTLMLPSTLDSLEPLSLALTWWWDVRPVDLYVNRMYPPESISEVNGAYNESYDEEGPFGCMVEDGNSCNIRTWRLFVPMGAKKNYESAEHWNHFRTIIETPLLTGVSDGIDAVMSGRGETSASDGVYSLDGRMVAKDGSGVTARGVYIVKENGRARKVVMGR